MKYLIDLNDPANFINPVSVKAPDGYVVEDQHTVLFPEGEHRLFCMTDSIMHATRPGSALNSHEHYWGYEIFFVDSGSADVYINGLKSFMDTGSIFFLQPYQAHSMYIHSDIKYRGFFHDWLYHEDGEAGDLLRKYHPDYMTDPDFPKDILPAGDFFMRESPYNFKEVPPEECSPIRHKDRPLAQYELPGATMKMITARWENGGLCEMWCFEMKKGFYGKSYPFPANTDLYYVTDGEVKFNVYDEEFVAKKEHLVKIPKYAPRSFEAQTDAVMYDVGGLTRWYAYFMDRESIMALDPERAAKPETFDELRKKLGVYYKEFGYNK